MATVKKALLIAMMWWLALPSAAAEGSLPALHVDGRHLVTADGERVILHGFAQTYSPWFNERGTKWTNYDVSGCLKYNKGIIDGILAAGWKMTFVRQHMDPYWSNTPGKSVTGEEDISAFDFNRFRRYLDAVFVPMAEYAISKGLYVVMRPPGVCPQDISVGDAYQQYLLQVWGYVARHPKLKDNGCVMFELANEPVRIAHAGGDGFQELHDYFQPIADTIRHYSQNIILVPGSGWQSQYAGYAGHPVEGANIGYAVHCYPGWYNGGHGDGDVTVNYQDFKRGWDQQIWPVAAGSPVVVTEMDWAPAKYQSSWGKSTTGVAGGQGFGANFRRICDETGNVSWLLFTDGDLLAKYDDGKPDGHTFLTDPEACPRPCYRWYEHYASQAYRDSINSPDYEQTHKEGEEELFPLTQEGFNPSIWETGTYDAATGRLVTGQYGFGGWQYPQGANLGGHKYLVVELAVAQTCGAAFRLFDENNYWSKPYTTDFGTATRKVINLHAMRAADGRTIDPAHIYIAGFWSYGGQPIYIKRVFLSDDGHTPSAIIGLHPTPTATTPAPPIHNLQGMRAHRALAPGIYVVGERKAVRR